MFNLLIFLAEVVGHVHLNHIFVALAKSSSIEYTTMKITMNKHLSLLRSEDCVMVLVPYTNWSEGFNRIC